MTELPYTFNVDVTSTTENEDGSLTVTFEMPQDAMKLFASIGLQKVLLDAAQKEVDFCPQD